MAEISVIIPVYNGEKTIARSIRSVLAQTFSDIEVIVVNDGSTDGTEAAVRGINDPRVILLNRDNRGQGIARARGIAASHGKYLAFVDADDTIDTPMLERLHTAAERSGAELAQCGIRDINGAEVRERAADIGEVVSITDRKKYADEYFLPHKHTNEVCNKLILKSFLSEHGLSFGDTKRIFSEDLLLNIKMLSYLRRVAYVKGAYYNYYASPTQHHITRDKSRTEKIIALFAEGLDGCAGELKKPIRHTAANVILEYSAQTGDEEYTARLFRDRTVRRYVRDFAFYRNGLRCALFFGTALIAPPRLAAKMTHWFFVYRKYR